MIEDWLSWWNLYRLWKRVVKENIGADLQHSLKEFGWEVGSAKGLGRL